jgi:hypothetical protein
MKYNLLLIIILGAVIFPVCAESNREDYDLDDDGLIEINDLQDLNEIRNNANGAALYGSNIGCDLGSPRPFCGGFELTTDLDFDTNQNGIFDEGDAYWNGGDGWEPLPLFMAIFEGNGFVIRNLTINRSFASEQGLFGIVEYSNIRRLALIGVSIHALDTSGAVVAKSLGNNISGIFATGEIFGGDYNIGGLIGFSIATQLSNSFSSVTVNAYMLSGALVGYVGTSTALTHVLAVSKVNLANGVRAGLGDGSYGQFIYSYMATDVAGLPYDNANYQIGSFGALLSELKCPVSRSDGDCIPGKILYFGWINNINEDLYWDFGTNQELPGLVLNGRLHRAEVNLDSSSSSSSSQANSSSSSQANSSSSSSKKQKPKKHDHKKHHPKHE